MSYMLPKNPDVVIVGGGGIGTSIAYFLAKQGVGVCLVERCDIAGGTTSHAANVVATQTKPPGPKQDLARVSIQLYQQLSNEFDNRFEFVNEGSLLVAETDEQMALVVEKSNKGKESGLPVELLDSHAVFERIPSLARHIRGGAFCALDSTVVPYAVAFTFAEEAKRLGATLLTDTEVIGIERKGERIQTLITNRGQIATETVVCACGVWSPMLAKLAGLEIPIEPRKGELFVTEAGPPVMHGVLISAGYLMSKSMPQNDRYTMTAGVSMAQAPRGNLVVGSTRQFAGYDIESSVVGMKKLVEQTVTLMPVVADLHVLRFYAGLRPSTADGIPIISRHPEVPGFVIASGHEGDGIALSPATGHAIASILTDSNPLLDLSPFSMERFVGQRI